MNVFSSHRIESKDYTFSYRAPVWIKKILATVSNNEQKGPVFRFFMDLGDAGKFYNFWQVSFRPHFLQTLFLV